MENNSLGFKVRATLSGHVDKKDNSCAAMITKFLEEIEKNIPVKLYPGYKEIYEKIDVYFCYEQKKIIIKFYKQNIKNDISDEYIARFDEYLKNFKNKICLITYEMKCSINDVEIVII